MTHIPDDLVTRLRRADAFLTDVAAIPKEIGPGLYRQAADEIERLRSEVQELTYQRDQAHAEAMSFHGGMGAR